MKMPLRLAFVALAVALGATMALGQAYPARPVEFIPAGGAGGEPVVARGVSGVVVVQRCAASNPVHERNDQLPRRPGVGEVAVA